MLIPYHTDAPLYHRPFGVVGIILANVATYFITDGGARSEGWLLTFGNGLHPTEWFASAFLHFGPLHLIGNMIALWSFGLIIEGKIGTLHFLGLYALLCGLDGFVDQFLMLWTEPNHHFFAASEKRGCGGASGVIFAMMAIAMLWAPRNSFHVFWIIGWRFAYRINLNEISVFTLSYIYLALNLYGAWLAGFAMSTPVLHLLGAAIGAPIGLLYLRNNWVDCDDLDLLTVMKQDRILDQRMRQRELQAAQSDLNLRPVERASKAELLQRCQDSIERGSHESAFFTYKEWLSKMPARSAFPMPGLRRLVNGLVQQRLWREAAELLQDHYIPRSVEDDRSRLLLAGILVRELSRPRAALRVLDPVRAGAISPADQALLVKLRETARRRIASGDVEILAD